MKNSGEILAIIVICILIGVGVADDSGNAYWPVGIILGVIILITWIIPFKDVSEEVKEKERKKIERERQGEQEDRERERKDKEWDDMTKDFDPRDYTNPGF